MSGVFGESRRKKIMEKLENVKSKVREDVSRVEKNIGTFNKQKQISPSRFNYFGAKR